MFYSVVSKENMTQTLETIVICDECSTSHPYSFEGTWAQNPSARVADEINSIGWYIDKEALIRLHTSAMTGAEMMTGFKYIEAFCPSHHPTKEKEQAVAVEFLDYNEGLVSIEFITNDFVRKYRLKMAEVLDLVYEVSTAIGVDEVVIKPKSIANVIESLKKE